MKLYKSLDNLEGIFKTYCTETCLGALFELHLQQTRLKPFALPPKCSEISAPSASYDSDLFSKRRVDGSYTDNSRALEHFVLIVGPGCKATTLSVR
jgi:hypothetical protein